MCLFCFPLPMCVHGQESNVYNVPKAVYLIKCRPGWFITRQSVTRCNDLPDWNPFHFVKAQKQYWRSPLPETGQTSQLNVKRSSVKHDANWTQYVQFSNWHFVNSSETNQFILPCFCYFLPIISKSVTFIISKIEQFREICVLNCFSVFHVGMCMWGQFMTLLVLS